MKIWYRTGGLEVFGTLEFINGNHSEDNTVTTDTYANSNHVSIHQYAPNSFWYTEMGGKLGASYEFDKDNSIGFSYELNGSLYQRGEAMCEQTIIRNNALAGKLVLTYSIWKGELSFGSEVTRSRSHGIMRMLKE